MRTGIVKKVMLVVTMLVLACSSIGVFATWQYSGAPMDEGKTDISVNFGMADLPASVYIVKVNDVSSSGQSVTVNGFSGTQLNSTATLSSGASSVSSAKIKVYNNADETYAFNAVKYQTTEYDNDGIVYVLPVLKHGDEIPAGTYLEFEVQFAYKDGKVASSNVLNSNLNFEFTPLDELPKQEEVAVSGALEQFKNIINDVNEEGTFDKLLTQMDDSASNDRYDESYIGNVNGASDTDVALLEDLFQGNLTLNIDGVDTEVTIIIKRENVDNNRSTGDADGNEMAIYMTTDDLQKSSWWGTETAPVYVSVFSSSNDGADWYQLGEMYEGTATIKQYSGMPGSGSFDTDTWKSVGSPSQTIKQIIANLT